MLKGKEKESIILQNTFVIACEKNIAFGLVKKDMEAEIIVRNDEKHNF